MDLPHVGLRRNVRAVFHRSGAFAITGCSERRNHATSGDRAVLEIWERGGASNSCSGLRKTKGAVGLTPTAPKIALMPNALLLMRAKRTQETRCVVRGLATERAGNRGRVVPRRAVAEKLTAPPSLQCEPFDNARRLTLKQTAIVGADVGRSQV